MNAAASYLFFALFASLALGGFGYLLGLCAERVAGLDRRLITVWRMARAAAVAPLALAAAAPLLPEASETARGAQVVRSMTAMFERPAGAAREPAAIEAASVPLRAERPAPPAGEAPVSAPDPASPIVDEAVLSALIIALYVAGLAVALAVFVRNRIIMARLAAASRQAGETLAGEMEAWLSRLALQGRKVRLGVLDGPASPFLTGWRPLVIMPASFEKSGLNEIGEYALVHELIHVRRGDERDRLLGEFLNIFLWFNPVFGRIERKLSLAREMACDAETLQALGEEADRRGYARALIETPWAETPAETMISAFGPSVGKVRRMRIKAILSKTEEKGGQALFTGAAALLFAAAIVPASAAQLVISASFTGGSGAASSGAALVQAEESTPIRRTIAASPLAALAQLESLESLERLENIGVQDVLMNPANMMSIAAYASGASSTVTLTLEDDAGNPVSIVADPDNGGAAEIRFADAQGRDVVLAADADSGGREEVTLRYAEHAQPHFQVLAGDDGADLRFADQANRMILMNVREADDAAAIEIEDIASGDRGQFLFLDDAQGVFAPADGRVLRTGEDAPGRNSAGRYIVIDHGTGWSTIFYNLASIAVSQGQSVASGDMLGRPGARDADWRVDNALGVAEAFDGVGLSIVRTGDLEL